MNQIMSKIKILKRKEKGKNSRSREKTKRMGNMTEKMATTPGMADAIVR